MRIKKSLVAGGLACAVATGVLLTVSDQPGLIGSPDQVILVGSDDDREEDSDDDESAVDDADSGEDLVASLPGGPAFELEIDPELDARFGPRPVNAVQAAVIVTDRFGGQVVEAELEEANGRPIWEMELQGAAVQKVDVDALDGTISTGGDDG